MANQFKAVFYQLTSATIRRVMAEHARNEDILFGAAIVARELADTFVRQSPKFDPVRFLKDCGLE